MAGGPIVYESKKHDKVGDSTPLSEYMALYHASKKTMWVRNMLKEIGVDCLHLINEPTPMYGDNDIATKTATEYRNTPQTKHYLLKYHYAREQVVDGHLRTVRVPTLHNHADLHTKPVKTKVFRALLDQLKGYAPHYSATL